MTRNKRELNSWSERETDRYTHTLSHTEGVGERQTDTYTLSHTQREGERDRQIHTHSLTHIVDELIPCSHHTVQNISETYFLKK